MRYICRIWLNNVLPKPFEKPHCGDCGRSLSHLVHICSLMFPIVIVALVNASGRLGLSAVLPHPSRRSPPSDADPASTDGLATIPHLPLVDDWHDGQFSLRDVMRYAPDTSVRQWSMRMMQRYRYVIGESHSLPTSFSLSYLSL